MKKENENQLINRFEKALNNNQMIFFDIEEFEEIIFYYLDVLNLKYAKIAIHEAYLQYPNNINIKIRELEYKLIKNNLSSAFELMNELNHYSLLSFDFLICQGIYWSLKKNYKKAIYFFNESLKFSEDENFVHNCIAKEYFDNKNYELALFHYKKSLEYDINDDDTFLNIIDCYNFLNQGVKSIEFILKYIDKNPYHEIAWMCLGEKYFLLKKYNEAIFAFDYVIIINDNNIYGHYQKAICYQILEKWDLAIEVYNESIECSYNHSNTYYKMGKCYLKIKFNIFALKYFFLSVKNDEKFHKSWFQLALFYEKKNKLNESYFFLKKALEIDIYNIKYIKKIIYIEIQIGKFEEALFHLKELIELNSNNYNYCIVFYEILIILGEYSEAIFYLEQAIKKFKSSELYFQIASVYFLNKNKKKGEIYLYKALQFKNNQLNYIIKKFPILKFYL